MLPTSNHPAASLAIRGYELFSMIGKMAFCIAFFASIILGPELTPLALVVFLSCSCLVGIVSKWLSEEGSLIFNTLYALSANWIMISIASAAIPATILSLLSNSVISLEVALSALTSLPLMLAAIPAVLFVAGMLLTLNHQDALINLHRGITDWTMRLFSVPLGLVGAALGGLLDFMRPPSQAPDLNATESAGEYTVSTPAKIYNELQVTPLYEVSKTIEFVEENKNGTERSSSPSFMALLPSELHDHTPAPLKPGL